jgi:hypothetical protein
LISRLPDRFFNLFFVPLIVDVICEYIGKMKRLEERLSEVEARL